MAEVISQAEAAQMDRGTGITHDIYAWQADEPVLTLEHGPDYPCPMCGWVMVGPHGERPWPPVGERVGG